MATERCRSNTSFKWRLVRMMGMKKNSWWDLQDLISSTHRSKLSIAKLVRYWNTSKKFTRNLQIFNFEYFCKIWETQQAIPPGLLNFGMNSPGVASGARWKFGRPSGFKELSSFCPICMTSAGRPIDEAREEIRKLHIREILRRIALGGARGSKLSVPIFARERSSRRSVLEKRTPNVDSRN